MTTRSKIARGDELERIAEEVEGGGGGGGGGSGPSITSFDVTSPGTTYATAYTALRDGQGSSFSNIGGNFVFNRRLRGTDFSLLAGQPDNAAISVDVSGCYDIEFSTVIPPQANAGAAFFAPTVISPSSNGTTASQNTRTYSTGFSSFIVPQYLDAITSGLGQDGLAGVIKFFADRGQGFTESLMYHPEATMIGDATIYGPLAYLARRIWRWRLDLLQGDTLKILGIAQTESQYALPYFGYDGGAGELRRNEGTGTRITMTRIG